MEAAALAAEEEMTFRVEYEEGEVELMAVNPFKEGELEEESGRQSSPEAD